MVCSGVGVPLEAKVGDGWAGEWCCIMGNAWPISGCCCGWGRKFTWPSPRFLFLGAFFIPSKIRIRSTFGGRSSILASTRILHSGQRSSLWVLTISSKHFLQNVCWHGNTLLEVSSLSKHTEHSRRSFNVHSSMIELQPYHPTLAHTTHKFIKSGHFNSVQETCISQVPSISDISTIHSSFDTWKQEKKNY